MRLGFLRRHFSPLDYEPFLLIFRSQTSDKAEDLVSLQYLCPREILFLAQSADLNEISTFYSALHFQYMCLLVESG